MSAAAFLAIALLSLMAAVSPGPAVLMVARTGWPASPNTSQNTVEN